ncbi:MAG: sigma-70 family RNA polymerase sigma factor [Oscillospiraceae bacterium]|nr:sigma-70 family RNA polymerase sigma factor [Oscillospiraceae bacterium]
MEQEEIQTAQAGDAAAFESIFNAVQEPLFRIALSILKNRPDAKDALQETFINAYTNIQKLKQPQLFKTWITRILINNAKAIIKKNKKYLLQQEIIPIYSEALNEDEILVNELVGKLNEKERIVIQLKFFGGYELHFIAHILKCPESTVKSRLYRGLQNIKKGFDEHG